MKLSDLLQSKPQRNPLAVKFLKKRIAHPDFTMALRNISRVHSTTGFMPRGMMFVGETGVGKSTVLEYYRELYCTQNHLEVTPAQGKYPIVLTRLQADSGKRSFLQTLCIKLGVTPKNKATINDLEVQVITLLQKRGVELVLVDEFHHLASRNGQKNLDSIGDLLKNLMDIAKVPFVLAGTLTALNVLENHPELQRRFAASTRMHNLNLNSAAEAEKLSKILRACQKNCGLPSIQFNGSGMPERFVLASRGRIGTITAIIETAIGMAKPEAGITLDDLADAFDFCRADPTYPKCNPFSAPINTVKQELGRLK